MQGRVRQLLTGVVGYSPCPPRSTDAIVPSCPKAVWHELWFEQPRLLVEAIRATVEARMNQPGW